MFKADVKPEKNSRMISSIVIVAVWFAILVEGRTGFFIGFGNVAPLPLGFLILPATFFLTRDKYVRFFTIQVFFSYLIVLYGSGVILSVIPNSYDIIGCLINGWVFFHLLPMIFFVCAFMGFPIKFPVVGNLAERWC